MNKIIEKYKCPCCGFYTFDEKPNGNYDICPVCFWEDDPIQLDVKPHFIPGDFRRLFQANSPAVKCGKETNRR